MSARLIAFSGLGPKAPAAFVVEAHGRRLLLDCGEGPELGRQLDLSAMGRIDAIVLSHSHPDHIGSLGMRERIGDPPVFATEPVLARVNERFKDLVGKPIPIRGETEVLGIMVATGANGHAPGGVWLRVAVGEGLLYMGDHSIESRLYAFDVPPATPTMIIDGSYGDAETSLADQRNALAEIVAEGPVLLPVPADGRAVDIAIFLQEAGFDVAIDEAVRSVAIMLTQSARPSAKGDAMASVQKLLTHARSLDANSAARGAMVAHGGSGDAGVAGTLIKRWGDAPDPTILFTGHLPVGTTGRKLVDNGRAKFQRWNVHPRLSDNLRLIEAVDPKRVIPAFGDPRYLTVWRDIAAPREIISTMPVEL